MTRRGLTLIELVVVLAILAALATAAVVMTENTVDQARYDATQKTLQSIDDAVLGSSANPDSPCFLADIGRLPLSNEVAGQFYCDELTENLGNLPLYGSYSHPDHTDVKLLAGYRGPYLRLPSGQRHLQDGWGRPYLLKQSDGVGGIVPVTAALQGIVSIGSAGAASPPYDAVTSPLTVPVRFDQGVNCSVTVSVEDSEADTPSTETVTIRLFEFDTTATGTGYVRRTEVVLPASLTHTFTGLTIGTKAVQFQQGTRKSQVYYLRVPPGGLTRTLHFNLQ